MYYYNDEEIFMMLKNNPGELIRIFKEHQKTMAEQNGVVLDFNGEEIVQADQVYEDEEEAL